MNHFQETDPLKKIYIK